MNVFSPLIWLAAAALLALLVGWRLLRRRRLPVVAGSPRRTQRVGLVRGLMGTVFVLSALVLALLAASVYQYLVLMVDRPVAQVTAVGMGPQRFEVTVTPHDGAAQRFVVDGDQWQIDARVIRWRLPVALAGVPSLYRLDRLSGRYINIEQERKATRTVHALSTSPMPDLWSLSRRFPAWMSVVDADYGSAAFLPLVDGGRYEVTINPRGGLVAAPADDATRERLSRLIW